MKIITNTPATRASFCLMVVLGLGMLMPRLAAADTFTFSLTNTGLATDLDGFAINTVAKVATIEIFVSAPNKPTIDRLLFFQDNAISISTIFVNEFQVINNVSTLVGTLEFENDFITSSRGVNNNGGPFDDSIAFTFDYSTVERLAPPPPTPTPEPSSLLLLGTGLLTGLGALRRKLQP
jgi:PEP-CTERM motif-containing protein